MNLSAPARTPACHATSPPTLAASIQSAFGTPKKCGFSLVEPRVAPNAFKSSVRHFSQICSGLPLPGFSPPSSSPNIMTRRKPSQGRSSASKTTAQALKSRLKTTQRGSNVASTPRCLHFEEPLTSYKPTGTTLATPSPQPEQKPTCDHFRRRTAEPFQLYIRITFYISFFSQDFQLKHEQRKSYKSKNIVLTHSTVRYTVYVSF